MNPGALNRATFAFVRFGLMPALVAIVSLVGTSAASAQMSQPCYELRNGLSWTWTDDMANEGVIDATIIGGALNPHEQIVLTIESRGWSDVSRRDDPTDIRLPDSGHWYGFDSVGMQVNHLLSPDANGNVFARVELRGDFFLTITCLPAGVSAAGALCQAVGYSLSDQWIYAEPSYEAARLRWLELGALITHVGYTSDGLWSEVRFGLLNRTGYLPGTVRIPQGHNSCVVTGDYDPPARQADEDSSSSPSGPSASSSGPPSGTPGSSSSGGGGGGPIGGSNPAPPQGPAAPSSGPGGPVVN